MLSYCKPRKGCSSVLRSGHSVDFDDLPVDPLHGGDLATFGLHTPRYGPAAEIQAADSSELTNPGFSPSPPRSSQDLCDRGVGIFSSCKPSSKSKVLPHPSNEFQRLEASSAYPVVLNEEHIAVTTEHVPLEDGYVPLEDDDYDNVDAEAFVKQLNSLQKTVRSLRILVGILVLFVAVLSLALLGLVYSFSPPEEQKTAREITELASIPIVALLFTWFHIWLAIRMMFRPIEFVGLWQYGNTGTGLGWQGVVPRKAHKMAKIAYASARPYLDGPRDWLDRVDSRKLVAKVRPQLTQVIRSALAQVSSDHFPRSGSLLPQRIRERVTGAAVDKIQETSPELWQQMKDLLCDETDGVDNDGMIVKVFTENKMLLNDFFLTLGESEFQFIEHCGAAMGFICGVVQLFAFNRLGPEGRAVFLPVTGFFLGIATNWLAITMVFKPCFPRPIFLFGCHICDIQGLFLKRQHDVAYLYSKLLCEHFLSFNKVVDYLQTLPNLWNKLKEAYVAHNTRVLRQTLGVSASWLAPLALGKEQYQCLEEDLKQALVRGLYEAKEIHKVAGRYIGMVSNIEKNNCVALRNMPPDEFENLLHPIFQEDEWILILLGGILGTIVGLAQVFFLSH